MKTTIVSLVLLASTSFVFLTSCKNHEAKVKDAQEDVLEAEQGLVEAKKDSLTAYESFKIKMNEKITANEAMIANLKTKAVSKGKDVKATYDEKIIELEKKNTILKTKLNNFKHSTGEDWEFFKEEIKENTDQIEKDFNELNSKK